MKEDFLHYVWQFKQFDFTNLKTAHDEQVTIFNSGQYLQLSGPDFFNAQIEIGGQKWAGNVEIHLKSSDWYLHSHEQDSNYDNVILHVVWENDAAVFRNDNSEIPVLELKNYVSPDILSIYNSLISQKKWIYCENQIASIDSFVIDNFKEKLFFERLQRKCQPIFEMLDEMANDWEAVLFCALAKNFGLNTNGNSFFEMAKLIPFSIIQKEKFELENLEALFFGLTCLLDASVEDFYAKDLRFRFGYLLQKYNLPKKIETQLEFFKHRPDNFPTIRLAQLAQLYHQQEHLFLKIIESNSLVEIYDIFKVSVSEYWQTRYLFDRESKFKTKKLSNSFIDLLLMNTVIPFKFAYSKFVGKEISEDLIALMQQVSAEQNNIVDKFEMIGLKSQNAYDSQSLLQLKNEYCNFRNCLKCNIGLELMKNHG